MSTLTLEAAPCMRSRLWSTSKARNVSAQAASTVVRTPLQSPGIALQLKGLQEFAVATLDNQEPTYVQRDVQVLFSGPPPTLTRCRRFLACCFQLLLQALGSAARGLAEHIICQPKTAGRGGL